MLDLQRKRLQFVSINGNFISADAVTISVIVPTIGRPDSLRRLLASLCRQTVLVTEVIIADGSSNMESLAVASDSCWTEAGLNLLHVAVSPPNAVRQRQAAIQVAFGDLLLLLDDDVVLEADCLEQMLLAIDEMPSAVAVCATFNNQAWSMPTRAWRFYLRYFCRIPEGAWQGKVIGPLLRYGFTESQTTATSMDWLGAGMSLIRRSAYHQVGGFSDFFLHRCTMNEDVDLGLKLSKIGRIVFCPSARLGHFHAPSGRVTPAMAAEDDLYNRYLVMKLTQGRSAMSSFGFVLLYFTVESTSSLLGGIRRLRIMPWLALTVGRLRAVSRILLPAG
jgi:GT2 family glycosyltransferase